MTETATPAYEFSKPVTTQISHDEFMAHLELERQQLLDAVDRVERLMKVHPTTAEIRKAYKQQCRGY